MCPHGALTVRLLLQFGHILRRNPDWARGTTLRARHVVGPRADVAAARRELERALRAARIEAEPVVVRLHLPLASAAAQRASTSNIEAGDQDGGGGAPARSARACDADLDALDEYCAALREAVLRRSDETRFALFQLPWIRAAGEGPERWVDALRAFAEGLPPLGLAVAGERTTFFSEHI
jgi:hypothetical protein